VVKTHSSTDASDQKPAMNQPQEGNEMEATLNNKAVRTTRSFGDVVRWMLFPAAMKLRAHGVALVPGFTDMRLAGFLEFFIGVSNKAAAPVTFWRRWPLFLAVLAVIQSACDMAKEAFTTSVSLLGGTVVGYIFAVPAAILGGLVGAAVAAGALVASLAWLLTICLLGFAAYGLVLGLISGVSVAAGGGFAVLLVGALLTWLVSQVGVLVAAGVFARLGAEGSLFGINLNVFEGK